jgi:hypothetical protein
VRFDVYVPESSPEIVELRLERWRVGIGDTVEPGTVLCDLIPLTKRHLLRPRERRTPFLARFRTTTEHRPIRREHAPSIVIIAAEHGIVGSLDVAPDTTLRIDDRVARIDVGGEPGDGGRFGVLAEILHQYDESIE